jgi:hypothetical protein
MANFPIFGVPWARGGAQDAEHSFGAGRGRRPCGVWGGCGRAAPARDAVRAALRVGEERVVPLSRTGPVMGRRAAEVRHRGFTMHGIPVRGAHATVVGSEVVAEVVPAELPELLPVQARLDGAEAAQLALAHVRQTQESPVPEQPGELVYLTILGVPVLAYRGRDAAVAGGRRSRARRRCGSRRERDRARRVGARAQLAGAGV